MHELGIVFHIIRTVEDVGVNRSVGTIIGDIQQLSAHFVCGNGLYKTTLLIMQGIRVVPRGLCLRLLVDEGFFLILSAFYR